MIDPSADRAVFRQLADLLRDRITTATARMPTPAERRELEMGEGIPVIVIFRADGSREMYAADRVRVGR
ncbi:hypothetical protein ACQP1S_16800 [Micromonospora matsumotoense]|uniref:hypothetical protein n=1 Tax=Micromonospora matsumotoense TaxID=121616 RepID=UPI003D924C48